MEDSEDFNELEIASKTWEKSMASAKNSGYREGIDDGSESVIQDGFDEGYAAAFKTSFALGVYKSLATALPKEEKISPEIEEILKMTSRGACLVCKEDGEISSRRKTQEKSIEEVKKAQREHSVHTIRTLYEYFEPLFKKHNLNFGDLPHPDKDL